MQRIMAAMGFCAFALVATAPGGARADGERTHDTNLSRVLAPGVALDVRGILGWIRATPAHDDTARILAHAISHGDDPASVRIVTEEKPGRLVVCAFYPSEHGTNCDDRHESTEHGDDHDRVVVDFTVAIPRGHRFIASSVNGNVSADGLSDDVEANAVNGNVDVATSGSAKADTVNGNIVASIGNVEPGSEVAFTTVNGSIDLTVPRTASAAFNATTLSGNIDLDPPIAAHVDQSGFVGRTARGTLGSGGPQIRLNTVNGAIRVHGA